MEPTETKEQQPDTNISASDSDEMLGSVFCHTCGMKCVLVPTGVFNIRTGKPKFAAQCPAMKCGHLGVDHLPGVKTPGFWARVNGQEHCPRCGKTTLMEP